MSQLNLVYAPGVMPGKWLRRFEETHPDAVLDARPLPEGIDPFEELAAGRARVALVRFPEGLSPASLRWHVIELYTERAVVCAPKDHDAEYFEQETEIPAAEAEGWPRLDPADYPPEAGGAAMMLEVVSSGSGSVAILPLPVARLHSRKDVIWRYLEGEPATVVGLVWARIDPALPDDAQPLAIAANSDPLVEEFIGVVRGRRANSSRQPSVREREQREAEERRDKRAESQSKQAKKENAERRARAAKSGGRPGGARSGKGSGGRGRPSSGGKGKGKGKGRR